VINVDAVTPFVAIGNGAVGTFGTSDFTVAFFFKTTSTDGLFDVLGNR